MITKMERTLITTADGSHSLYVKELDEHYHSIHGAIQESIHVFINTGLKFIAEKNKSEISILEIGFGTGLNALLTCLEAEKLNLKINYTSIEAFPLDNVLINELNYAELLSAKEKEKSHLQTIFNELHSCEWEKEISISKNFTLHKIKNTLQEIKFEKSFDLIYFDAFGPRVQPEMWTEELFSKIYNVTKPNGCLVTYCAKGEVKRTLKKVGFTVETLPGPPRKREMVRADKA
jgi:tRNA U34 5-methylaminomethyl-2-thiouridine-forming methyltransferase MnmC